MLNSPESIQKQLSEAISVIGSTDFPMKWPELITQMVENFATGVFCYICIHFSRKFCLKNISIHFQFQLGHIRFTGRLISFASIVD